jgi:hypothetical protein
VRTLVAALLVLLASWAQCSSAAEDPGKQHNTESKGNRDRSGDPGQPSYPSPALVTEPEDFQPDGGLGKAKGQKQREQYGGWNWDKAATITNALATAIIAVFTFFLVRYGAKQARATTDSVQAMRDSVTLSRETAMTQLRAYVGLEEATVERVKGAGYWIHITIKNAGSTPALGVDCLGGLDFGFYPEPGDDYEPRLSGPRAVLMPGCTLSQNLGPIVPDPQQAVWIQEGQFTLYAFGSIRYTDFFGAERVTNYRVMTHPSDLRESLEKTQMLVCREGNSVT